MDKNTLIAQITDCHLPADPKRPYRGINPHRNLKKLLRKVKAIQPDLLLASGDLSEDGSRESYRQLKKYLNTLGVPVLALPGNHDEAGRLAEVFPGSPVDTISVTEHGGWQIIRLNSCLPGKPEGLLSEQALMDLKCLLEQGKQPRLIAVHHQPIPVNSPWIDKYPLLNAEALLELIDTNLTVKTVVWGHVHQVFQSKRNGVTMLGSPSSAINGLATAQRFTPDSAGPACRWVKLSRDGTTGTGIVWMRS